MAEPLLLPVFEVDDADRRDYVRGHPHGTNRILAVAFVFIISLPLVLTLTIGRPGPQTAVDDGPQWPGVPRTVRDVGQWPTRFRRWFKDHYTLRRPLIRAQGTLVFRLLGTSPSPTVVIGRDGWWYHRDDGGLEDIVSVTPLGPQEMNVWRTTLEDNRRWLEGQHIPYLFVLAPDKHLIYPEFLPDGVRPLHEARLVQLQDFLRRTSQLDVIDLRGLLLDAKHLDRVYHRTDTHWNNRGALVVSLAIVNWMARMRPGMTVPTRSDFEFSTYLERGLDLPAMLGLEHQVTEEMMDVKPRAPRLARVVEPANHDPDSARVVTEHPDRSLPRVLIFRDSFMTPLIPFLPEHCSRCVFQWQKDLDPAMVLAERPDLVIHEIVGRRLQMMVPYDAIAEEHPAGPK